MICSIPIDLFVQVNPLGKICISYAYFGVHYFMFFDSIFISDSVSNGNLSFSLTIFFSVSLPVILFCAIIFLVG